VLLLSKVGNRISRNCSAKT